MVYILALLVALILVATHVVVTRATVRKELLRFVKPNGRSYTGKMSGVPSKGYIYIFHGRGENSRNWKIGRATDVVERMRSHRTANPHGVVLVAVFRSKNVKVAEMKLHRAFAHRRISNNNEWFRVCGQMRFWAWCLNDEPLRARTQAELG